MDRKRIEIKTTTANECRCGLANVFNSKQESLKNNMMVMLVSGSHWVGTRTTHGAKRPKEMKNKYINNP